MIQPSLRQTAQDQRPGPHAAALAHEFETLVERYRDRAYFTAYRLMGSVTEAEDLTQEALVRAWAAFERYDRARPFEAWLFRILSNLAIDGWRRQSQLSICSLDAEGAGPSLNRLPGSHRASLLACLREERVGALPEPAYLRSERARKVQQALAALPEYYRDAVVLADVYGYSYEEIARLSGCVVGTVRSRIFRGRQLLRDSLEHLQR